MRLIIRATLAACLALLLSLDAEALPETENAVRSTALQDALDNFVAWDVDDDGRLTLAEIDRAIASPAVTGRSAAAAVALRRLLQNQRGPSPAFTPDSLREVATTRRFVDSRDEEQQPGVSQRDRRPNYERYH